MTFSICAHDPATGEVGVGAITAMIGVGKLVSHAQAGVGAAASQGLVNPYLALDGLALLAEGKSAQEACDEVIGRDDGRDFRQLGLIGADGSAAAWTGPRTPDWSGHRRRGGVVAQGNRLIGPETVEATLEAFHDHADLDLAHRLLEALEAGEATGADREGALSGAIYVMSTERYPLWDVRVDHAEDPAAELRTLLAKFEEQLLPQVREMSTREDYVGAMTRRQMEELQG